MSIIDPDILGWKRFTITIPGGGIVPIPANYTLNDHIFIYAYLGCRGRSTDTLIGLNTDDPCSIITPIYCNAVRVVPRCLDSSGNRPGIIISSYTCHRIWFTRGQFRNSFSATYSRWLYGMDRNRMINRCPLCACIGFKDTNICISHPYYIPINCDTICTITSSLGTTCYNPRICIWGIICDFIRHISRTCTNFI